MWTKTYKNSEIKLAGQLIFAFFYTIRERFQDKAGRKTLPTSSGLVRTVIAGKILQKYFGNLIFCINNVQFLLKNCDFQPKNIHEL